MDKQRSFSLKPIRFLLFSFTLFSSFLFLAFFSIYLITANPSLPQQTTLHFNQSFSLNFLTLQTTLSTTNFTNQTLVNPPPPNTSPISPIPNLDTQENYTNDAFITSINSTHFKKSENVSGFDGDSLLNWRVRKESKSLSGEELIGNSSTTIPNFDRQENDTNDAFITSIDSTHFKKSENVSGFDGDSLLMTKESNSLSGEGLIGNSSTMGKHKFGTSIVKTQVLSIVQEKRDIVCDVSKGQWVYDDTYPLYTNTSCPFIDEGFNCEANGRSDKDYIKWRWQPQDCDIPRFNATKMLELIRGKRLVFVGDSINRNQWESMMCLLMGSIKDPKRVYEARGRRITKEKGNYCFKFVDYKCTVEYYVTHFLVHESKARIGKKRVPTLRIDTMDRGSSRWKGADILVFNTAHWWNHFKTQAGINYYQEGDQVHPRLDVLMAFRKALETWSSWVDKHINPGKTQVFFRTSSPSHFRGGQWNAGGHCKEAAHPINGASYTSRYPEKNIIVEEVIKRMKTKVTLLNISRLSEYRIDGHPSIYGKKRPPGKTHSSSSSGGQDCSHWCLPGVPDTWNQLLYFHLTRASFLSL